MIIDAFLEHATGLEAKALEILRRAESYPGLPALERHDVVLRLMKFEGLGKYWIWIVAASQGRRLVRRLIWDRPGDYRTGAISPTTFGCDASLPGDVIEKHLGELPSLVVPPFLVVDSVGLDGVHFGVEHESRNLKAGLYWWSEPPEGWRPLAEWFDRCVAALEALLPSHYHEGGRYGA